MILRLNVTPIIHVYVKTFANEPWFFLSRQNLQTYEELADVSDKL